MNKTTIGWCDLSTNPIKAIRKSDGKKGWWCSHTSPGCEHCYAETINNRFGNQVDYKAQNQNQIEFFLDEKELAKFAKVPAGKKVFVEDMADLFHGGVSTEMIALVFAAIRNAPQAIFQILTKRAERMQQFFITAEREAFPLPNCWLGVSAEDQQRADERIPLLLQTPAAVRFISAEPLLGPINLTDTVCHHSKNVRVVDGHKKYCYGLNWVIIGGESGRGARACREEWIRSLVDQCKAASVPAFVKQYGSRPFYQGYRLHLKSSKGGDPAEWEEDLRVREFPNYNCGRRI